MAAAQGDDDAQSTLGVMHHYGHGVPQDYVTAYKWLKLALTQGFESAKSILDIVESTMTSEQIAEAKRLAGEFKPIAENKKL